MGNTVPGPCDYCRSSGTECRIDIEKRKQKPFYFVSEEEYRHLVKLLKHYLPNHSLDLPTLRSLAANIDGGYSAQETQNAVSVDDAMTFSPLPFHEAPQSPEEEMAGRLRLEQVSHHDLHVIYDKLGHLLADARGQYRESRLWWLLL